VELKKLPTVFSLSRGWRWFIYALIILAATVALIHSEGSELIAGHYFTTFGALALSCLFITGISRRILHKEPTNE